MREYTFRIVNRGYDPKYRLTRRTRPGNRTGFILPDGTRIRRSGGVRSTELPGETVLEYVDIFCKAIESGVVDVLHVKDGGAVDSLSSEELRVMAGEVESAETSEPEEPSDPNPVEPLQDPEEPESDLEPESEDSTMAEMLKENLSEEPTMEGSRVVEPETEPEELEEEPTEKQGTEETEEEEGPEASEIEGETVSSLKRKYKRSELNEIADRMGLDSKSYKNETEIAKALLGEE